MSYAPEKLRVLQSGMICAYHTTIHQCVTQKSYKLGSKDHQLKQNMLKPLFIALNLSVMSIANAGLIEIDTSFGNGADSYIHNGNKDSNYGSANTLLLRNDGDNGWHRQSYIRFDLSDITETVANASFDLALTYNILTDNDALVANVFDVEVYGLLDSSVGNNWSENAITWNNAAGNNVNSNGFTSDFSLLGTLSLKDINVGDRFTLDNDALVNFINNDSDNLVTLGLRRVNSARTDSSFQFASKENANNGAPMLSLTTTAVPEPGTLAIFGLGLIGLVTRRFIK
ncbi:PEP motif putative anchor domain protein [Colwellia psychrerythraea]|uniref:PEP motif putative anchor domain protein n=1 Tax=Colwellia psychrerythraea TaxID=28229 RepID=A0A099KDH5_COLPS|nr:PEP motif putative anchor domain protein [Colwellia psychrerythraea]